MQMLDLNASRYIPVHFYPEKCYCAVITIPLPNKKITIRKIDETPPKITFLLALFNSPQRRRTGPNVFALKSNSQPPPSEINSMPSMIDVHQISHPSKLKGYKITSFPSIESNTGIPEKNRDINKTAQLQLFTTQSRVNNSQANTN